MELQGNNFNGDIFNSLTQFKELNFLDLSYNKKIKCIPQSIEKLDKLNRLFLKETNLKELPYGIFKLSNLKGFYLESSSSIFKIIKFGNKSIECSFFETPILCYQPDSCNNIDNNLYRNCTMEEISEVKSKLSIENTKKNDISEDCKKFNTFVNKTLNSDCCEEFGISCDENDFIKKLYINNDQDSIVQYHFDNLYDIDFDIFPNLTHIEKLEIINIKLKSIPNSIFQLPLKILTLNRNNLMGELPNEFKNLKNIQEINLNENKFSGELYIPKSLKFLFAENNNFNLISNTKMNDSLEKLYLPGNNFNGNIFNELGHYKNLKELNLNNNRKIEYIPSTIKDLSKLENLMIDGTSIKKFPNGVFLLPNLNEINIGSKNNIGAKIVHFCKSKITCNFNNISLLCYEPESCYNINIANTIKPCTYEEIRKILPNRSKHYCNINDVNDDKESNINTDPYNENIEDGMTFKFGIENNIMNGIVIVAGNMNDNDMINEIDNSLINNEDDNYININYNRYKNKNNDYRNKIKNEKDSKKNKEKYKDKPKHKNRIKNKTNEDDKVYFIYLVLSLIGINGTIITILFIVCLLSYSKSKNKIDYHNNENIDSDIIISEKIIIYNKEDIQNEEKILSKKNENKENYLIEEIKMKKDINLKEIKKKKMRKIIY
jgi:Leucine-rich repeat (LRR) protein